MLPILSYKNVNIERKTKTVLSDITFSISPSEFVYLTGSIGSGKSSLLKTIYADLKIKSGQAKVAGFDLLTISRQEIPMLRRELGIVFQDFQLLTDRNVFDNLKFVMEAAGIVSKNTIENRIGKMLEQMDLKGKENSMPHELSGGEQQRTMIARAMLNNPKLIIADEPTASLDLESTAQFMHLLIAAAAHGTAVLMVTHNEELVKKYPARELKIESGKLYK